VKNFFNATKEIKEAQGIGPSQPTNKQDTIKEESPQKYRYQREESCIEKEA